MAKIFLCLLACMFVFSFCKSARTGSAPKPPERYLDEKAEPPLSTITIPVSIHLDELQQTINKRLQGNLYEDYSYKDNGGDDLMLRATKSSDITLYLSGNTIKYRVPLKLWFKKNLYLTDAEAEGELAIAFKSTYNLNSDWTLRTETGIEYHEWLDKPVLKTGLGNINVESIANIFLTRYKKTLGQLIDKTVSQELSLRPYVEDAWKAIQAPALLSEEYRLWLRTTPVSIGITPLSTRDGALQADIAVECYNEVNIGEKPAARQDAHLPNLRQIQVAPDDFQMRFATEVPFPEAERLLNQLVVGQEFESGKRKVKIDALRLWGNDDRIVVDARLSGSYQGNVYFIGKPEFNPDRNQIEVRDLDFHADTRNFLHRSAAWIFQGPIRKKIGDAMVFPIHENLEGMRQSIQQSLDRYEIYPGVILSGSLDSLAVEHTRVTPTALRVDLFTHGKVHVDVKGL